MTDPTGFSPLVPGFEFMQSLVKSAGTALPGIGQWVAPTIDPEEIAKRIEELRTVQFWLEQNARMIGATIQAMEVQRMTLSTLKTMNVRMDDLRESMQIKMPSLAPQPVAATRPGAGAPPATAAAGPGSDAGTPGVVDPMQWWSALTRQFTELATTAMKDSGDGAARALAAAGAGASAASGSAPSTAPGGSDDPSAKAKPGKPVGAKKGVGER